MDAIATIDQQKLEVFVSRILDDLGAVAMAPLVRVGDELGLYDVLAQARSVTAPELARRTGTVERLVREWLNAHAAAGYLDYDATADRYVMTDEQAMVFGNPDSPVYMLGAFEISQASMLDQPKVTNAFRNGGGLGYHERCQCLFSGISRFFGVSYKAHLLQEWLPALSGVVDKLRNGAKVADIGCGHGTSLMLMAEAFDRSTFRGFDYHTDSVDCARREAERAGLTSRVAFEVADAKTFAGGPVRSRGLLRRAARHGRPGRRRPPRAVAARAGRHLHGDRTARRRSDRGQFQPGRTALLRGLDDDLHAGVAGAGCRIGAGRAGRTEALGAGAARGRIQPGSARRRNALQPRARSTAVGPWCNGRSGRQGRRSEVISMITNTRQPTRTPRKSPGRLLDHLVALLLALMAHEIRRRRVWLPRRTTGTVQSTTA